MIWSDLIEMIREEVGYAAAERIEKRARREFGGARITIGKRPPVTVQKLDLIAPGRPQEAAKRLGVHVSTVYRTLRRDRLVR